MDKRAKFYFIVGPVILSFVFAATQPTVQIYFMKLISSQILAVSNMIAVGIAAITNTTITSDKLKELYRKHFTMIVIVDVTCFSAISYGSILDPNVRFIGFAILDSLSTTLWSAVISNAVNNVLNGDKLTTWNAFARSSGLYASLVGGLFAVFVMENINISVEACLFFQCASNCLMGFTDLKGFNRINKKE